MFASFASAMVKFAKNGDRFQKISKGAKFAAKLVLRVRSLKNVSFHTKQQTSLHIIIQNEVDYANLNSKSNQD